MLQMISVCPFINLTPNIKYKNGYCCEKKTYYNIGWLEIKDKIRKKWNVYVYDT